MSPALSTAAKVRDFVRSLKPGDRFTTLLCAEAISFKPRPYSTRPGFDYGPISGPLFDVRMAGAVKVVEKDRQRYVYEVMDISELDSIQNGPARMGDCRDGSGEGCKHPNRLNLADFTKLPPGHVPQPRVAPVHEKRIVSVEVSLATLLAGMTDEDLFTELRRRIRGAGNKTSEV